MATNQLSGTCPIMHQLMIGFFKSRRAVTHVYYESISQYPRMVWNYLNNFSTVYIANIDHFFACCIKNFDSESKIITIATTLRSINNKNLRDHVCIKTAIKNHKNKVAKWLIIEAGCFVNKYLRWAMRSGNLSISKWLRGGFNVGFGGNDAFDDAVKSDNLELIKWAQEEGCPIFFHQLIEILEFGKVDYIKTLLKSVRFIDVRMNEIWKRIASRSSNMEAMEYMYSLYELKAAAYEGASLHGDLNMLNWLKDRNCPCDVNADNQKIMPFNAMTYCPIETLHWFIDNGFHWPHYISIQSLVNRGWCLSDLKWAYNTGCRIDVYDKKYFDFSNANIEVIDWLIQCCGLVYNEYVIASISSEGIREVEYNYNQIIKQGDDHDYFFDLYVHCIKVDNQQAMDWLYEKGIKPSSRIIEALLYKPENLKYLDWLLAHGCEFHEYMIINLITEERTEYIPWLRDNGCPWTGWTYNVAATLNNIFLLEWLKSEGCPMDEHVGDLNNTCINDETRRWFIDNGHVCREEQN